MIKVKDGYAKLIGTTYLGSADRVLLSNGGDKAISDFAAASALSNYVTLTTAQIITGVKTFARDTFILAGSEHNDIKHSTQWAYNWGGYGMYNTTPNYTGMYNSLDFYWYNDIWSIGNLRGGNLESIGFGIGLKKKDTNGNLYFAPALRITETESYINNNKIWHAGNDGSGSGLDADTVDGYNYNNLPYLPLTGGTMKLGEGLKFHADSNYFGTYADARIISLLDNGTICDGGLIIDSRGTSDGVEHVIELLRIRPGEFKWKGLDILHSGNYSSYLGYIGTTPVQASSTVLALTGITNATISGLTNTGTLTITNTEQKAHLLFSRGNYNYIAAPTGGSIAFCVNGKTSGERVNCDLVISDWVVHSGLDNATSLGEYSFRWSNVYSVLGNYSGQITSSVTTGTAPFKVTSTTLNTNLNADMLDGVHLAGHGGKEGVMRSWKRGTFTTVNLYFGNGNVVVIDPRPTDGGTLSHNTIIFSLGDSSIRNTLLAFMYERDEIKYRRAVDGPTWGAWRTIAFTDSDISGTAAYANILKSNSTTSVPKGLLFYSGWLPQGNTNNRSWCSPTGTYTENSVKGEYGSIVRVNYANTYYNELFFNANIGRPSWRKITGTTSTGWKILGLLEDIRPSGYVTSSTASLSSYWGKLWEYTLTALLHDLDITFYIHSAYNLKRGFVHIRVRRNPVTTDGVTTYTNSVNMLLISGNIPTSDIRLYHDATSGKMELWLDVKVRWGVYNANVISCTPRFGNEVTPIVGTLFSNDFTTVLTLPTYSYITLSNLTSNQIQVLQYTINNIEYPLIWSNLANTNSITADLLYKSYSHLTYNPSNKRITAGSYRGTANGAVLYWGDESEFHLGKNNTTDFYFWSNSTTARLRLGTNGSERLTILANGNVGIGTTSPEQKLHVDGLVNITANSGTLTIGCLNTSRTHYSTTGGTHWFNKAVEVNGNLTPHANTSFNLGSDSKRWSTIYGAHGNFSGTIKMYTGDSALAIYSGRVTNSESDGNICFLTSIDNTDPQSHSYPTLYGTRCTISLQPRGGSVYIGTNPDGNSYKFYVNGTSYLSSTLTMGGVIVTHTGSSQQGIKFGTSYLNSLSNLLLWQSPEAIRFGSTDWDWNAWAGLKYNHSSKIIYLGLADGTIFNANSGLSGGKLYLPGISNIYTGNGANLVWHSGNDGSGSGLDADLLDGYEGSFYANRYSYMVAAGKYLKIVAPYTSQLIISGSITLGLAALLCYYSVYGHGTTARTRFKYIYYSSEYKVYINNTYDTRELYIYNGSNNGYAAICISTLNTSAPYCEVVDALPASYVEYDESYALASLSILDKYLKLSGGTMTGPITLTSGSYSAYNKTALSFISTTGTELTRIGTDNSNNFGIYSISDIYIRPNHTLTTSNTNGIKLSSTQFTYNTYNVLHAGNYTSYTVKKDGTGATGTWGINITGSADSSLRCYPLDSLLKYSDGYTVEFVKEEIVKLLAKQGEGVGYNIKVPTTVIGNWDNPSYITSPNSTYSLIKISGGYSGSTYGLYLLSSHYTSKIGYVGRNNDAWSSIKWLATTEDIDSLRNYYWADIKISSSANANTSPTFAHPTSKYLKFTNGTEAIGYVGRGSYNNNLLFSNYTKSDVSIFTDNNETHCIYLKTGGNVGIGTTNPGYKLEVNGTSYLRGDVTITAGDEDRFLNFLYTGSGTGYDWRIGYLGSGSGDANYFVILSDKTDGTYVNALRIGLTSLAAVFGGTVTAAHFYESSDINLKTNIETITTSDNIPLLKSFDWKSDGSHSYGLIALELEEQGYSELVSDEGGLKTVNYSAALSLIVGKLQVKIKELEKEIETLKNKN